MSPWRIKAVELVSEIVKKNEILNVFEVGCDDAGISRELAKKYSSIQFNGIDIRKKEIESANYYKEEEKLNNVKFDYGYFLDITNTDIQYDIIIFTEVYEHLVAENQIYSLRLLGNLLSPNGFLIFTSPNGDYILSYLEKEKSFEKRYPENFFDDMKQTDHWLEPTQKEINKIFVSLGFDILESRYFNLPKRKYQIINKMDKIEILMMKLLSCKILLMRKIKKVQKQTICNAEFNFFT